MGGRCLALAKLLLGQPNLLLLDEPTNHLDLEARNWLEEFLLAYAYSVIVVSHDRFFLDKVVTRIADLNLRTLTDYHGNYSEYILERDARMDRLQQAKREQDAEIARVRQFIDRFRYQATKASQMQSRIKMLEKVIPIEAPPERHRIHFTFPPCAKSGRTVLEIIKAHTSAPCTNRSERRHLISSEEGLHSLGRTAPANRRSCESCRVLNRPTRASAWRGIRSSCILRSGRSHASRSALTVYETLAAGSPLHMVPAIETFWAVSCSRATMCKRAAVLSGGERTRLAVARMLLRPSNTLLLDEPTNHLDLDSKEVLLEALEAMEGRSFSCHTIGTSSRNLRRRLSKSGMGMLSSSGTYLEFLWHKSQLGGEPVAPPTRSPSPQSPSGNRAGHPQASPNGDGAVQHEVRKRQRSRNDDKRAAAQQSKIADLESRIADREQAIRELEATMAAPGFYDNHEAASPSSTATRC